MSAEPTQIPIAEQFYSIQGEGPEAGTPAVFLRLAGCNLMCGGNHNASIEKQEDMYTSEDATWLCDTISVWRQAAWKPTPEELVDDWEERGWIDHFRNGAHLVCTGGEPTLPHHQEELLALFEELGNRMTTRDTYNPHTCLPFIEVETNGTKHPHQQFIPHVKLFNVSVKLANSGMPEDARINDHALYYYANSKTPSKFKFVVSRDEDVPEIMRLIDEHDIPDDRVSLMPAGQTQEQLRDMYPRVADLCKENCWDFTPRLQVDTWDLATGV